MTKAERAFFLEIERGAQRLRDEASSLKAENAALRARAVPEVVWPDDVHEPAKAGIFELFAVRICNSEHDWRWAIHPGEGSEEMVFGYADSLEGARRDCVAAFLRLVGCKP